MSSFEKFLIYTFNLDVDGETETGKVSRSAKVYTSMNNGLVGQFFLAEVLRYSLDRPKEASYLTNVRWIMNTKFVVCVLE